MVDIFRTLVITAFIFTIFGLLSYAAFIEFNAIRRYVKIKRIFIILALAIFWWAAGNVWFVLVQECTNYFN